MMRAFVSAVVPQVAASTKLPKMFSTAAAPFASNIGSNNDDNWLLVLRLIFNHESLKKNNNEIILLAGPYGEKHFTFTELRLLCSHLLLNNINAHPKRNGHGDLSVCFPEYDEKSRLLRDIKALIPPQHIPALEEHSRLTNEITGLMEIIENQEKTILKQESIINRFPQENERDEQANRIK